MAWRMESVTDQKGIETVVALGKIIWNEHYGELLGERQIDYMLSHFQSTEAISRQIEEEGYRYSLLYDGVERAGYVGIRVEEDGKLFISKLYLLKEFRGRGLARFVMGQLDGLCRRCGITSMWLTVNKYNDSSIAAYHALGFSIIRSQVTDIGSGYVMDDYVMEREIPEEGRTEDQR